MSRHPMIASPSPSGERRATPASRLLLAAALASIVVGLLLTVTLGRIVAASPSPRPAPAQLVPPAQAARPAAAPGDASVPDAARALAGQAEPLQEPAPTF